MKSTSQTGLLLTLFMLLLVLLAAFVFLFQGRQSVVEQRDVLQTETADLQQDLAQTELNLAAAEATRAYTADALATAESNTVLLDGELVRSQQEVDALTGQLDAASQTITALEDQQEAVLAQPPEVAILSPVNGRVLALGEPVNIVLVATDPKGVIAVNLALNEEPFDSFTLDDQTLFTAVVPWEPAEPNEYVIALTAVNSEGISSRTATITVTVALTDAADRPVPDANVALSEDIGGLVSGLRQLPVPDGINARVVSGAELRLAQDAYALAQADSPAWFQARLVGQVFDFAPADYVYPDLLKAAQSSTTAAFYEPLSDELLVLEQANPPNAVAQLAYVRQLVFLLQDQNFGLDVLTTGELTLDATLALAALSEGEATVVQENFLEARYLPLAAAVIPETFAIDTVTLQEAPAAIANRLLFAYEFGDDFARFLYDEGSYPALNEAWANPPQSTEQILHPEKYADDEGPSLVTLPDLQPVLGSSWALTEENVLGEFMLGQYLAQQLNESQVETAVSGWGGDRFAIYTNEAEGTFVMVLHAVWDTPDDSTEFAALYPNYPTRLFGSSGELQANGGECWEGDGEFICLNQSQQDTLIVRGPELALLLDVVAAIFPTE